MQDKALLIQPGAYGDIFICAPIANYYTKQGYKIFWPTEERFLKILDYFDYVTPIILERKNNHSDWLRDLCQQTYSMFEDYDLVLNLADRGPHPTEQKPGENFEQCKYRIAYVPFKEKHNLEWTRDLEKEDSLYNLINPPEEYAIAHLTNSHGDTAPLPPTSLPLVTIEPTEGYTIPDWYKLIINAKEVYCVESAFHQFIDGFLKEKKENYYLLKKGPVSEGTRHTVSEFWNLSIIGENTIVAG